MGSALKCWESVTTWLLLSGHVQDRPNDKMPRYIGTLKTRQFTVLPTGRAWFLGEVRYQYGVGGAKSLGVDVRRCGVYLSGPMLTSIST